MQLSWCLPGPRRIALANEWSQLAVDLSPLREGSPEPAPAGFALGEPGCLRRMPRLEPRPQPHCPRWLQPELDHIVVAKSLLCLPVVCSAPDHFAPSRCWLPPPPVALWLLNIAAVQQRFRRLRSPHPLVHWRFGWWYSRK